MGVAQRMLARAQGLPNAKDIEVKAPEPGTVQPTTAVGTMAQLGKATQELNQANEKIAALEARLASSGARSGIPVDKVRPNPWQPRIKFDEPKLTELAESIKEIGLLQPVLVRLVQKEVDGAQVEWYELIAGERRWRAHQRNGMAEILAIITEATDADMAVMALAENISRDDLEDYEIAKGVVRAESEFKNRKRMAEAMGLSRGTLYRYLAFAELPAFIVADLDAKPGLLGGSAASDLVAALKKYEPEADKARALELAQQFWAQVRDGVLDQGKLAEVLEGAMARPEPTATDTGTAAPAVQAASRDIHKLYSGKTQAGSITADAASFTVKLKRSVMTPAKEELIRKLIKDLFPEEGTPDAAG